MYVEIHAKSDMNDESRGKTTWVNTDGLEVQVASTSPKHLGYPAWHIEIKAKQFLNLSNGDRGGEFKGVIRTLEVHLTPTDLSTLLNLALAKDLLSVSIATRDENTPQQK